MQAHNDHVAKLDDGVVLGRDGYPHGSGKVVIQVICNFTSSAWRRGAYMNYTVLRVLGLHYSLNNRIVNYVKHTAWLVGQVRHKSRNQVLIVVRNLLSLKGEA